MFDFSHLNIDISQPRTWFTQDIYMESWEVENYKFNWDDDEVESFIDNYLKELKKTISFCLKQLSHIETFLCGFYIPNN